MSTQFVFRGPSDCELLVVLQLTEVHRTNRCHMSLQLCMSGSSLKQVGRPTPENQSMQRVGKLHKRVCGMPASDFNTSRKPNTSICRPLAGLMIGECRISKRGPDSGDTDATGLPGMLSADARPDQAHVNFEICILANSKKNPVRTPKGRSQVPPSRWRLSLFAMKQGLVCLALGLVLVIGLTDFVSGGPNSLLHQSLLFLLLNLVNSPSRAWFCVFQPRSSTSRPRSWRSTERRPKLKRRIRRMC